MEIADILRNFLPVYLVDNFDIIQIEDNPNRNSLDIYLDEKKLTLDLDLSKTYISYGFTQISTIQDFPIRGKGVFLHLRRRKWQDTKTKEIVLRDLDITYAGTQLSKDFVAFLKATN